MEAHMRLFLLLLVACGPAELKLSEDPVETGGDTGTYIEPEPEPPVEVDFSKWNGHRTIKNGDCAGVFSEEGDELTEDWEYYESAKEVCPECDHFYDIEGSPSYVCDVPMYETFYRALAIGEDGGIEVRYWSSTEWAYVALADNGVLDGLDLTYSYTWPFGQGELEIEGVVNFEELEED
jgi:hypothetical protein